MSVNTTPNNTELSAAQFKQSAAAKTMRVWLPALPLVLVFAWSYGPALVSLSHRWVNEADYNHCFFVPVFSAYLLWTRRSMRPSFDVKPSRLSLGLGVLLILSSAVARFASLYFQFILLEPLSLLPCVAGVTLLLGGWSALRWAWPAILFLGFMVPLPGFFAGRLSHELQLIGTICSTFVLQTAGIPAIAVGNVIRLTHTEIGVVEACSGLRMMNLFFAITLGASFVIERPILDKVVIVMSAFVIGVVTNIVRISATGMAHEWFGRRIADLIFHDFAGWLMMPMALVLLFFELWLLSRLVIPTRTDEPLLHRE